MIDIKPLKQRLEKAKDEWIRGLPTEVARQALLDADAAVKSAEEANATEQLEVDEKYLTLAIQAFCPPPAEDMEEAARVYDEIAKLTQRLHELQVRADARYEAAKRLFAMEPRPSQKAIDRAREQHCDVYGTMVAASHPVNVFERVGWHLASHVMQNNDRPFVKTAFLTPQPRPTGGTCWDALAEEQAQNVLKQRQLGPR